MPPSFTLVTTGYLNELQKYQAGSWLLPLSPLHQVHTTATMCTETCPEKYGIQRLGNLRCCESHVEHEVL